MEEKKPEDKRYLKWYHKVAYGSGDLACNLGYGLIGSFIMIYLTNTVGLNSAIIGTLMMFSKFLDGVTDVFFGSLMDRTHTKLGKARPWMLYAQIGVSLCTFLLFCVPAGSITMQYVYFFIVYTSLNAVFFTANNIAYSALSALITRNANERVQLGSIRFMFALFTGILVPSITMGLVESFGGGAAGWRTVALIYSVLALIINTISCLSVRELPEEKKADAPAGAPAEKISLIQSAKYLVSNKYYLIILGIYLCQYCGSGITQGVGVYYMTYIMGNASLLGLFSMAQMLPMIVALSVTPILVKKFGSMWKVNFYGFCLSLVFGLGFIGAALAKNVTLMLACMMLKGVCTGSIMGTLNAYVAETSAYTFKTQGVHLDGTMFSCSSLGVKVGGGIGSALCGLLLAAGGFDGLAAVQTDGALRMITFMYIIIPFIFLVLQTLLISQLKVEKANRGWDAAHTTEAKA
ncbi:MAG: MFS transporter [Gemmiger sp.]|uniref:MFS transporter n=1 Tax=Gemmiger sp. TaxID=2049027 RepID=UPI002A90CBE9|nr:MFS transporter [Gemmiger sp.]MDY5327045.1 MFS transporter [Gemmiger sp.]